MDNINYLLEKTLAHQASDLHLSTGIPPWWRIHGDLHCMPYTSIAEDTLLAFLKTIMPPILWNQFQAQSEADFAFNYSSTARFRVNVFRHNRGVGAAFRVIPSTLPTIQELNLPDINYYSQGLILITGPTGSGKTTTLATLLHHTNQTQKKHILTIEDPIEFIHHPIQCLIHQREVQKDTQTFQSALHAALREDPDIILVGELRDLNTIRLAITAAETGHLVLATLHTHSTTQAIHRIINVFPGDEKNFIRTQLAAVLQVIIAQQLIKKINNHRTAAFEILINTPAIQHLIRENKLSQIYSVLQTNKNIGMQTFDQHLDKLTQQNLITPETAQNHAVNSINHHKHHDTPSHNN